MKISKIKKIKRKFKLLYFQKGYLNLKFSTSKRDQGCFVVSNVCKLVTKKCLNE